MGVWTSLVVLMVIPGLFVVGAIFLHGAPVVSRKRSARLCLCMAGLFLASPLVYEFPPSGALDQGLGVVILVAEDGSSFEVCPNGAFEFGARRAFNVLKKMEAKTSVMPITENPKVRQISYSVRIEIARPEVFFKKTPARWEMREATEVRREVVNIAARWLYEFNEHHSKGLGELYNPLDEGQVSQLRKMVLPWLNEKLEPEGLRGIDVAFKVN